MKDKVNFDDFAQNYNELLRESTSFFSKSEKYFAEYKVSILKKEIDVSIKNLLEYGCGIGRNLEYLQMGFPNSEIHATDISLASLDIVAASNSEIKIIKVDDLDKKKDFYDCIFVAGVFHHIHPNERRKAMLELREILKPGGSLFIFEHNPFNPITRKIVNNCIYDEDAILLNPKELKLMVQLAGFEFIKQKYCLFIPPRFKLLSKIEYFFSQVPLGGQYWIHAKKGKF